MKSKREASFKFAGKVFGVGLPRTGTTSCAIATTRLGLRTLHTCFDAALFEQADAFFDTPIYVDYPALDRRFRGSRFILTWRDPDAWFESLRQSLAGYFRLVAKAPASSPLLQADRRCYLAVFGSLTIRRVQYMDRYRAHRDKVVDYFRCDPRRLLLLDMEQPDEEKWRKLARFLELPQVVGRFPRANVQRTGDWRRFQSCLSPSELRT